MAYIPDLNKIQFYQEAVFMTPGNTTISAGMHDECRMSRPRLR